MKQKAIVEAIYKGKTKDEKNVNLVLLHFSEKKESKSNFYIPEKNCPYFQLQIGELYKLEITRNIHNPQKSIWDLLKEGGKFHKCIISKITNNN